MKLALVVVAAGRGARMGRSRLPKPFVPLDGVPGVVHVARAFAERREIVERLLLAPPTFVRRARADYLSVLTEYGSWRIEAGGPTRQDSVRLGVELVESAATHLLIHDGARPLVDGPTIARVIAGLKRHHAVIPVAPVWDTVKRLDDAGAVVETLERTLIVRALTPQGFRRDVLASAYDRAARLKKPWADEAELLERLKIPVHTVPGDGRNVKITTPEDLELARALLRSRRLPAGDVVP